MRTLALVCALLLAGACSGSSSSSGSSATTIAPKGVTLLTIGGSATEGVGLADRFHDAWPYRFFQTALPRSSVFVNGAMDDATARRALTSEVPLVQDVKPDVVAIWLGIDDVRVATPISTFSDGLTKIVNGVRAGGVTRVLIADLPSGYGAQVAPYNDAIRSVARATNAQLVELADTPVTFAGDSGLGANVDATSERAVADAFARAFAQK